jgi:glycosyltransferase involved in cell wall biosynthesis
MHIAVFLQHYHTPDCPTGARPFSLVQRLARDHQVTVITTRTWYDRRLTHNFPWTPAGVDMRMLEVPYHNAMTSRQRLWAYLRYAAQAFIEGLQIRRPDLIWGSSTPLSAAIAAAAVARFRGVPWIFEVRDLWPDFPIQMGAITNPLLISMLKTLEHRLYRSASHIVTLSPDMETHVRDAVPDATVSTVEYGSEFTRTRIDTADVESLRTAHDLPKTGIVLYAGTFGRANAIPALIQTARQLRHREEICFVFTGHGYHESTLRSAARTCPNIRIIPPQPRSQAHTLFHLADLSICSFIDRPVLATNAPSKLLDSLATGTPVIVTNPGWTRQLVQTHECGWYVPPEQPDALAQQIEALFDHPDLLQAAGMHAADIAQDRFDRNRHMNRIQRIVQSVAPTIG